MKNDFKDDCAWRVEYKGGLSREEVLVIAPDIETAVEKAINYQQNYAVIKGWPIVSIVRQADTII